MKKQTWFAIVCVVSLLALENSPSYCLEQRLRFSFSVTRLADGTALRDPLGLGVSQSNGDIFVADTGNNQVRIFNSEGILIKSIGRLAGVRSPIDVAVGMDGTMYVTEMRSPRVTRLDFAGHLLSPILPEAHEPQPQLGRIHVSSRGEIYVADRSNPRVLIISDGGRSVRQMEQTPQQDEPQWKVQDVTTDDAGNIYILSSQGAAVNVFRQDGAHLRSFGARGPGDARFSFPTGAAFGPDGNLWIVDSFKHEVKVFSATGEFLFRWGRTGLGDGELFYPIDIAFGKRTLYVLEKGASRLQAFKMSR